MANLTTTPSKAKTKSLGDPNAAYESMRPIWERARAVLNGQQHARAYDDVIDTATYNNLLLPFSPTMTAQQYNFYRAEGELPGLTAQYAKVLVGGLLRKQASMELPENLFPEGTEDWIRTSFGADGTSLHGFLDAAIWEELQSSRAWCLVDYPTVANPDALTMEEAKALSPYVMLIQAENIINWRRGQDRNTNKQVLTSLLFRYYMEDYSKNEFHPDYVDTVTHYHLDESGFLVVDTYTRDTNESVSVINGNVTSKYQTDNANAAWSKTRTELPLMNGERMNFIPAYPLNGQIDPVEPILQSLIDREIALYNKISRRNHLLYGAATYTPVVMSDMTDEEFENIVDAGLGSWIKLRAGDDIKALDTPTGALKDMEKSIEATIEEMARMGIRMLSPEGSSGESGVSLEIRNAAQTAQLGMLNTRISETMRQIIAVMLKWKYNVEVLPTDIKFTLSADFNPTPVGADWMRLVTEWYQQGIIPRSTFISIAKFNDVLPAEYNDEDGIAEIQSDPLVDTKAMSIDSSISDTDNMRPDNNRDDNNDNENV
jgi:hypothetical protein